MNSAYLPTIGAVLATSFYLAAAATAVFAARRQRRDPGRATVWRVIAFAMLALAILRVFDSEQHMARMMIARALGEDWFVHRAGPERLLTIAALVIGGGTIVAAAMAVRRLGGAIAAAGAATSALVTLALLRIISLHASDRMLGAGWGPLTVSRAIEFGALAIPFVAANQATRRRQR